MSNFNDYNEEQKYRAWSDWARMYTAVGLEPALSFFRYCELREQKEAR